MKSGRRMFLAALIIAFKYLHDKSFSASAWSKISGLKICEVNASERAFLAAVKWNLHISEPVFRRWIIVLEYSTSARWRSIIPHLTPSLDLDEASGCALVRRHPTNAPSTCSSSKGITMMIGSVRHPAAVTACLIE